MLPTTVLVAVLAAIPFATATEPRAHNMRAVGAGVINHSKHFRRAAPAEGAATRSRAHRGQCRVRPQPANTDTAPPAPASDQPAPPPQTTESVPQNEGSTEGTWTPPTPTNEAPGDATSPAAESTWDNNPDPSQFAPEAPATTPSMGDLGLSNAIAKENPGTVSLSGPCGQSQADANFPNGQEWWLNCGIDNGGWNPPHITVEQLKYVDLSAEGTYAPCAPYFDKFYQYGNAHNIPPIMIAAIAMQESTCNPTLTGPAGERGMMQLAGSNCDGSPGGNCHDLDFNINRGAEYLRGRIDANGGNVLLGVGAYNGWHAGITVGRVFEMRDTYGCASQPNLDYMDQLLNGWLQGQTGYSRGTWRNRDNC